MMKKYCLNQNLTKDEFDDGEIMFYNNLSDEIHILNSTACEILDLVLNCEDIAYTKKNYISKFHTENSKVKKEDIENDFETTLLQLLETEIILEK